ncbi:hypothetical protein NPX13_g2358 [Xylaria arbuscula]|uniref:Uncharacterized protein n=1 Tax=Xylaria arbuscula TaxID=114810 RepID=A0A9W8NK84_9PEZI|nr:hypothetical protein NPX13_g2358 [Xylaria arbuscula]
MPNQDIPEKALVLGKDLSYQDPSLSIRKYTGKIFAFASRQHHVKLPIPPHLSIFLQSTPIISRCLAGGETQQQWDDQVPDAPSPASAACRPNFG